MIIKQYYADATAADLCREHEFSRATPYSWKAKYGGIEASQLKRIKEPEEENNTTLMGSANAMRRKNLIEKKLNGLMRNDKAVAYLQEQKASLDRRAYSTN